MQKKPRIVASQEIPEQFLGLSGAALDIHRAKNGNDVLQQEFRIVGSAIL